MATLTENVARVTSALDDIKNAIIGKGVTPTGKCETFADAIASIPSGGGKKCSTGRLNAIAGQDVFVECGFEPTMIMVSSMPQYGAVASTDTSVYVKGASTEKHSFYRTTANQLTQENTTNANLRFTLNSNGFYYRSRFTKNDYYYMAVE